MIKGLLFNFFFTNLIFFILFFFSVFIIIFVWIRKFPFEYMQANFKPVVFSLYLWQNLKLLVQPRFLRVLQLSGPFINSGKIGTYFPRKTISRVAQAGG